MLRKFVSGLFALVSLISVVVFSEQIDSFLEDRGWDQALVVGWRVVTRLGWESYVAFTFFSLAGATLALWAEYLLRRRANKKRERERHAESCIAHFTFTKSDEGKLDVQLGNGSQNVRHFAWYVNNGGTMRNEAVLLFVEFDKPIQLPAVYANGDTPGGEWREFYSADRFMFVELNGWPTGSVVLQAFDSRILGLDRRAETMVWRNLGPIDDHAIGEA